MLAAAKKGEHGTGISRVAWLAQNIAIERNDRVRRDDRRRVAIPKARGLSLHALRCGQRRSGSSDCSRVLVDVGWADVEGESEEGEQIAAAGSAGGEDQSRQASNPADRCSQTIRYSVSRSMFHGTRVAGIDPSCLRMTGG